MGEVIIRDLDDEVIEWHRRRAERRGMSLEELLREVLTEAAPRKQPSREELLRRMDEILAMTPEPPPGVEPVEGWMLRYEDHDSR